MGTAFFVGPATLSFPVTSSFMSGIWSSIYIVAICSAVALFHFATTQLQKTVKSIVDDLESHDSVPSSLSLTCALSQPSSATYLQCLRRNILAPGLAPASDNNFLIFSVARTMFWSLHRPRSLSRIPHCCFRIPGWIRCVEMNYFGADDCWVVPCSVQTYLPWHCWPSLRSLEAEARFQFSEVYSCGWKT